MSTEVRCMWAHVTALVGYSEYPVLGVASGIAGLSTLRNETALELCLPPGIAQNPPTFSGRLVRTHSL